LFKDGLYGFEELNHFLLLKKEDELFFWLNSIDQPEIAFPLMGLRIIDNKYPQNENYEAFGVIKLNRDPIKTTINMRAPVYINQNDKTGYQIILSDESFPVEYQLFTE
jgi:flagellar assembly factor FliW